MLGMRHKHVNIKGILARNMKKYRGKLKLTQEQAAERADIGVNYWQRMEMLSQSDLPSLPMLFKISKGLDVEAHQLLIE